MGTKDLASRTRSLTRAFVSVSSRLQELRPGHQQQKQQRLDKVVVLSLSPSCGSSDIRPCPSSLQSVSGTAARGANNAALLLSMSSGRWNENNVEEEYEDDVGDENAMKDNDKAEETLPKDTEIQNSVEEMLQRARQLRVEAAQEEATLRQAQRKAQTKATAELDALINDSILSLATKEEEEKNKDVMVSSLADWMQDQSLQTSKALALLERLHQREQAAWQASRQEADRSITTTTTRSPPSSSFQIAGPSLVSDEDFDKLKEWPERWVLAAQLLVQRKQQQQQGTTAGAAQQQPKQQQTNEMANALQKRLRELRRSDSRREEEAQQRAAVGVQEGRRRREGEEQGSSSNSEGSISGIDTFVKDTMGTPLAEDGSDNNTKDKTNKKSLDTSRLLEEMESMPMWISVPLLPYVLVCEDSLDPNDVQTIQTKVLMGSDFYCTSSSSIRKAAIYRGNIRRRQGQTEERVDKEDDTDVWKDIQERLEQEGLASRIQLFFLPDPEQEDRRRFAQQDGGSSTPIRPVIVALPKSVVPAQGQESGWGIKLVTSLSTLSALGTCFVYSIAAFALNPTFVETLQSRDTELVGVLVSQNCLPLVLGLLGLQVIQETTHAVAARQAKVQLGWPVLLPSLRLGTFGSITPLRSFPSSRTALFDVALSGPAATMLVSLAMILLSLWWSIPPTDAAAGELAASTVGNSHQLTMLVPAGLLKSSSLIWFGASLFVPQWLSLSTTESIPLHPLFFVGLSGLVTTALNLLPIGRLDGGRLATAVFGRRMAYGLSLLSLVGLAIAALSGVSAVSIFWGLLVTVFQRQAEIPLRDEWTPLTPTRQGIYAVVCLLTILTLVPVPGGLPF